MDATVCAHADDPPGPATPLRSANPIVPLLLRARSLNVAGDGLSKPIAPAIHSDSPT